MYLIFPDRSFLTMIAAVIANHNDHDNINNNDNNDDENDDDNDDDDDDDDDNNNITTLSALIKSDCVKIIFYRITV